MTVKIGLTVSGAISLGAYEGGALAALLVAAEELRGSVEIDVIAGASAGAITGLVAARCLTLGADPVESMTRTWVDLPDIHNLATHSEDSPLSAHELARRAVELLGPDGPHSTGKRQQTPVRLTMAMCSLAGLNYRIKVANGEPDVDAVTYLEWSDTTFDQQSTPDSFVDVASRALASGANPVGLPPKRLSHSEDELNRLRDDGVVNLGSLATSWYTDGGTLDNEPFGRLLDVIAESGVADSDRLLLLVHPIPTRHPGASVWTNPEEQPRWPRTGLRAKALQGDQTIFGDLRALAKVNRRLEWVEMVVDALAEAFESVGMADRAPTAADVRAILAGLIGALDDDHESLNRELGRSPSARPNIDATSDMKALLRGAIQRATGLASKRPAVVEIVSPALDPSHLPAGDLLAGEKLGHFFGFLDARFRRSDFGLGYRNMEVWLRTRLDARVADVEPARRQAAWTAVHDRYDQLAWDDERHGDADYDSLSVGEKLHLCGVLGHVAHITERDVRHWSEGLPVRAEEMTS